MWTSRNVAAPNVSVAAERERVLARRAETLRESEARKLLSYSRWDAEPEQIEEVSRTKHAHLPPEERREIMERALELVRREQAPQPEEEPVIKAAAGPKLTPEQRSQVKALVRRELQRDPSASASAVRRMVERELDISINQATFHTVYWNKVKAEENESVPHPGGIDAAPAVVAAAGDGAAPQTVALASPEEEIRIAPGPDGQWLVQIQVTASRAQALRLMQAVVGVLAAEE